MKRQTRLNLTTALIVDAVNRVLMVRKCGTEYFMQPGGKIGQGETAEQALIREIQEELGVKITSEQCCFLGAFSCQAANEPDTVIDAKLFFVEENLSPEAYVPSGEIEEVKWVDPFHRLAVRLAPYSEIHVLPLWRQLVRERDAGVGF